MFCNGMDAALCCIVVSLKVKHDLWKEAQSYPLYHMLSQPSSYIFKSVTLDAKVEVFYDETRRLCDLKLFHPMLKLVEPEGNRDEMLINSDIGSIHETLSCLCFWKGVD